MTSFDYMIASSFFWLTGAIIAFVGALVVYLNKKGKKKKK